MRLKPGMSHNLNGHMGNKTCGEDCFQYHCFGIHGAAFSKHRNFLFIHPVVVSKQLVRVDKGEKENERKIAHQTVG